MRKSLFLMLVLSVLSVIFSLTSGAQSSGAKSKPDFSGTWLLDTKKSQTAMTVQSDLPITISHHDPEFRITISHKVNGQVVKRDLVFFTDGRGEDNEGPVAASTDSSMTKPGDAEKKPNSKTEWNGDKIVTVASLSRGNFYRYQPRDEWKLSEDGKVLTQYRRMIELQPSTIYMNRNPAPDKKMVYNRM